MTTKVIFLDIDGVLCTNRSCVAQPGVMQTLDVAGVNMLDMLLRASGAKLVISSTWREFHERVSMQSILQNSGMKHVPWHTCWKTPVSKGLKSRGSEIKEWMQDNGTPDCYLILDDNTDMLDEQKPSFVKTDTRDGVSWQNFLDAVEILKVKGSWSSYR